MGKGGNACKRNQCRERKVAAGSKEGKSQLKVNAEAMSLKCQICLQPFMKVQTGPLLKQHWEAKHPKKAFHECFPEIQLE
ncbi:hypothetical protein RS030_71126 [Cryptosporidium xiaoi]|uniref:Uncharacterized protein n=1 Tax=Cryptosporidium xiaoi TaxID=659607 RepID=A0AAV9XTA8_9CRYT